jgi:hypothetical protein
MPKPDKADKQQPKHPQGGPPGQTKKDDAEQLPIEPDEGEGEVPIEVPDEPEVNPLEP